MTKCVCVLVLVCPYFCFVLFVYLSVCQTIGEGTANRGQTMANSLGQWNRTEPKSASFVCFFVKLWLLEKLKQCQCFLLNDGGDTFKSRKRGERCTEHEVDFSAVPSLYFSSSSSLSLPWWPELQAKKRHLCTHTQTNTVHTTVVVAVAAAKIWIFAWISFEFAE